MVRLKRETNALSPGLQDNPGRAKLTCAKDWLHGRSAAQDMNADIPVFQNTDRAAIVRSPGAMTSTIPACRSTARVACTCATRGVSP